MKRRALPACLCIAAIALAGCVRGRAALVAEQPWWATLGGDLRARAALSARVLAAGYLPRVVPIASTTRPLDAVLAESAALRRGVVVVGPLVSLEWRAFAAARPDVRFVLVGVRATEGMPQNVTVLSFDRRAAFREAGGRAARAARAAGGAVAILTAEASELEPQETAAFADGAGEAGSAPTVSALPGSPDRAAVRSAVEELRRAGASVILLGLGPQDPWALEVMKDAGGSAVLADWSASRAFAAQVLLSVEQDVAAGIGAAASAAAAGRRQANGPVRIVQGGADTP